jgi:Putative MetA-pathway of phenol degradation
MKKIILSFSFILVLCTAFTQTTKDLETDRPDQTETPFSVGKNMFQAENGFSITKLDATKKQQNIVSLLRYGISEKFELRAEILNDRFEEKNIGNYAKGFAPLEIGFKANLLEEKKWIPKTSLIAHLALPKAAGTDFKGRYYAPNFRFTMQHMVSKKQSFSYNLGGEWGTDDGRFTPLYTVATGYDFSSFLYGYIELFGFFPQQTKAEHSADMGFAFLVKPNVQFDISAGIGLTSAAPKNYWALGLSFRLPK